MELKTAFKYYNPPIKCIERVSVKGYTNYCQSFLCLQFGNLVASCMQFNHSIIILCKRASILMLLTQGPNVST